MKVFCAVGICAFTTRLYQVLGTSKGNVCRPCYAENLVPEHDNVRLVLPRECAVTEHLRIRLKQLHRAPNPFKRIAAHRPMPTRQLDLRLGRCDDVRLPDEIAFQSADGSSRVSAEQSDFITRKQKYTRL